MGRKIARQALLDDSIEIFERPKSRKLSLIPKQKYPQAEKNRNFWFKSKLEARTAGQQFYIDTINESDITICTGPAGCGKTWIVARLALEALASNRVNKIVVTKPIIEAGGESLGYVKGEIEDKTLPYFSAILDCFEDHVGPTILKSLLDSGKIEFKPLAYLRGYTGNYTFFLADETENMTRKGIKLLMTRLGEGSIMVLNGDDDQCDLPNPANSGLKWASERLVGKNSRIGVVELHDADIQRNPLIRTILENLR